MTRKRRPSTPSSVSSPLGEQIRYAREFRDHSQEEAGIQIGVLQPRIAAWERGVRPRGLSREILEGIARYIIAFEGAPWTPERVKSLYPPVLKRAQREIPRQHGGKFGPRK